MRWAEGFPGLFDQGSFAMARAQAEVRTARRKAAAPVDAYVGGRVRMRRKMLGMSQGNLGAALGLTFQQIQKYEKGANRIGASRLQQMTEILNVPISYFFQGWPADGPAAPAKRDDPELADVTKFMASSDGIQLIKAFVRIKSPKQRKLLMQMAREMADQPED
jgi:transcriptional regulator with XRE-family HTH domain